MGVRKQKRKMVPLCALRRPLLAGTHVQAFFAKGTARRSSEREDSEGQPATSTSRSTDPEVKMSFGQGEGIWFLWGATSL